MTKTTIKLVKLEKCPHEKTKNIVIITCDIYYRIILPLNPAAQRPQVIAEGFFFTRVLLERPWLPGCAPGEREYDLYYHSSSKPH